MPLIMGIVLAGGIFIGAYISRINHHSFIKASRVSQFNKLNEVVRYIETEYVDTISEQNLVETSINAMLKTLDPHSAYIPAEDLQAANEPLEGNFEGIGIEYHIQKDSLLVVSAVAEGPSEIAGLKAGDRIVKVEGKSIVGITGNDVVQKLRGPDGSEVKVSVYRRGHKGVIDYTIKRGKIPIYSIDAAYMIDDTAGYIKISRFGSNTTKEFREAMKKLHLQGMQRVIVDLRDNPGGYLNAATQIADEFLKAKQLIVYTQGKARPKEEYFSTTKGDFEKDQVIVLINEGSASASEILAGALQDLDRGVLVGRRSFGKGLVQEQTMFPDGSALRLTIARYYTPSGRCIQKSYVNGEEEYENDIIERYRRGELENADSIKFPDSLKYKTKGGRTVYGGGGIMPDIFVPLDTSMNSKYLSHVQSKGLINQFTYDYVDENRKMFNNYKELSVFVKTFDVTDALLERFIKYAEKQGIKASPKDLKASAKFIKTNLKALMARQLWKNEGYYYIMNQLDAAYNKAYQTRALFAQ